MSKLNGAAETFHAPTMNNNRPAASGWDEPPAGRPRFQRPGQGGGRFNSNGYGNPSGGGFGGGGYGGGRAGEGRWIDGKHIIGEPNPRLERELYGVPNDPTKQHTGINFEKYDDIPVEASGTNCPEPVTTFTSPPLDPHLLSNIELSGYKNPTPVQKYSIPIVLGGRDLMACAQTGK